MTGGGEFDVVSRAIGENRMIISVFGLGYVGCVTGACFAKSGHRVIGVDSNMVKVDMINAGESPIVEEGIQELIASVVNKGLFSATADWREAVAETDVALICVGTPSRPNGRISLNYIERVSENIGDAIGAREGYCVVGVRSTVFPGTVEDVVIPILQKRSGKIAGRDFGVCMVPEFLREGSSVKDFYNPPKTVIGEYDERSGDMIAELFSHIDAPLIRTEIKIAEMIKYTDNAFHALKVAFANEIGSICKELEFDSHKVMDIFCTDYKLNLSPYYLKPGFAFGGSCLPKDLRAMTYESKMRDVETPLLNAVLESNRKQILKVIRKLLEYKGCTLGFLGLSFKGGTDDLRESPIVEVIEAMIGKGFAVRIYDKNVSLGMLMGSNKEFIEKEIPHISSLMCSTVDELVQNVDVIIVANHSNEFREAVNNGREGQVVVDLVRIVDGDNNLKSQYYGICW